MRRPRPLLRHATAVGLLAAGLASLPARGAPLPPAPMASAADARFGAGPGGDVLSYSQSVTPSVPVTVERTSALLGTARTAVPPGASRDPDGSVTTTVVPDADNVYFTGEPVAAKSSIFPFLWARKGFGHGAGVLTPPVTYTAAVSTVRWPFLQDGDPKPTAGRGHLAVEQGGITRSTVGYSGLGPASRLSNVTTVSGVLKAEGGDLVGGAYLKTFSLTNTVRLRLPAGTFPSAGGIWEFSLALDPISAVPFLFSGVVPGKDHDDLVLQLDLSGRVPQERTQVVDGERVLRQGIPFLVVLVDNVFDGGPVISTSLSGAAVVQRPDGSTTRGLLAPGHGAVRLAGPLLTPLGVACGYGFGADGAATPPGVTVGNGRGGAPALSDWTIAGHRRRLVPRMSATGLDIDGAVGPLAGRRAELDVTRHRSAWGDDTASVIDIPTTSFYGAFTDECSFETDHVHRATSVHESPGMKLGTERRLLYVTSAVVADIRIATVPSSRTTYSCTCPVLRVVGRVWSLDGMPHQVRVRALLETHGAQLQVADTTSGGGPPGPVITQETTVPGEDELFLTPQDGRDHYRLVSGNTGAGIRGSTDAAGRYAGPQGVITMVAKTSTLQTDPTPRPGAELGTDADVYLSSAASASSPITSFYTGFLAALIADDAEATGVR